MTASSRLPVSNKTDIKTAHKAFTWYEQQVSEATKEFRKVVNSLRILWIKNLESLDDATIPDALKSACDPKGSWTQEAFDQLLKLVDAVLDEPSRGVAHLKTEVAALIETRENLLREINLVTKEMKDAHKESLANEALLVASMAKLNRNLTRVQRVLIENQNKLDNRPEILRWSEKSKQLSLAVEQAKSQIISLEMEVRAQHERLKSAREVCQIHADVQGRLENDSRYIRAQEVLQVANASLLDLEERLDSSEKQFENLTKKFSKSAVESLQNRLRVAERDLLMVMKKVPSLVGPNPNPQSADWILECRRRRRWAKRMLSKTTGKSAVSIGQDLLKTIDELLKLQRERQRTKERMVRRREKKELDRQRRLAEMEKEDERERRREEARRRASLNLALHRQRKASDSLREFDSKHRRLDQRLEQVNRSCSRAEDRVYRVIGQIKARNPWISIDEIIRNRSRYATYDNAQAALEDLQIDHSQVQNLIKRRNKLDEAKQRADFQVQTLKRHAMPVTSARDSRFQIEVNEWEDAERLAEAHMRRLGYRDAERTSSGADGGVDVESSKAVAQVKDQGSPIGRPLIQQIFGVAAAKKKKPLFYARRFAPQAIEWGLQHKVRLFQFNRAGVVKELTDNISRD